MEFGLNKNLPLISIAIPTYNRAKILNEALCILIPQIEQYGNQIELIISDNASTDNTTLIVSQIIEKFNFHNILYNRNLENLGFFGNFIKCKELSNGKFIWLLSDDDHLTNEIISYIMSIINFNIPYSCIYLKNTQKNKLFHCNMISNDKLLYQENFNLGLISASIFINDKSEDKYLSNKYLNNSFIGFIFLLNSFKVKNKSLIIEGHCFDVCKSHPQGYNYFEVFINQWNVIYDFLKEIKINRFIALAFEIKYLFTFLLPRYVLVKTNKVKKFGTCDSNSIQIINMDLKRSYKKNIFFWLFFYPVILLPNFIILFSIKIIKKVKNTL
jgi:glycosyltransferase involved in cell wall biosynthesis